MSTTTITREVQQQIDERAAKVRSLLKQSTSAWLKIASEVVEAKVKLGTQLAFERFTTEVGFTKSVSDKLHKIGSCKRLHLPKHLDVLASVDGWTVLYELAKLDDKSLDRVFAALQANPHHKLTRAFVKNVLSEKAVDDRPIILGVIEIDSRKLANINSVQQKLVGQKLREVQQILTAAKSVVEFRLRETALEKLATQAAANTSPSLATSKAA